MKQAKVEEHGTIDALRQLVSVQLTRSLVALAILAIAALVAFNLWLEIYKHAHIFFLGQRSCVRNYARRFPTCRLVSIF